MDITQRGYMGRLLYVDLSRRTHWTEPLDERIARLLIGGKGIGAYLLIKELKAGIDPLSPDNVLIFGTGPLNGTMNPTNGKFVVLSKSPTTGTFLDSYCGGPFGVALKQAGYDFMIVRGASGSPCTIVIDDGEVRIDDASGLWGKNTEETARSLEERYGEDFKSALIGPAGERLSPIAGIMSELRIAARGGIGAVMGSKNLKAAVARGTKQIALANPKEFTEATWVAYRSLRMNSAVQRLTRHGSTNILELIDASGGLPTRNFQSGRFEKADELSGESFRERTWVTDTACFGCPISCSKIATVKSGKYARANVDGPEYETVYSFGSNCGVSDHDAILTANYLCDLYGVDTISAGAIVAFVMELFQRGIVTGQDLDGIEAKWGDGAALVELTERMCKGEGIGADLEKGVRWLSENRFPQGKPFAMQVKGLEMPAYHPNAAKGIALAYAISERGACHLHGAPITELLGNADPLAYDGKAALVRSKQLDVAITDSTVHCYFADFGLTLKEVYRMLKPATGFDFEGLGELERIAERIINLTRLFNLREGFGRKDDTLPERCLKEPIPVAGSSGETVDLPRLLDEYYRIMGWDEQGVPTRQKLAELGLTTDGDLEIGTIVA